jgi:hypothetical protein
MVDLVAQVDSDTIDIADVDFYVAMRDSADLFYFYHYIGQAQPTNNNSIWTYTWNLNNFVWHVDSVEVGEEEEEWEYDTTYGLPCGYSYKLRIMVTDIAGNVYDDYDGDGFFDDYTFWDYAWKPIEERMPADGSKLLFYHDCGAPDVAFCDVWTHSNLDTNYFPTPSAKLGGPDEVFAMMGDTITMHFCLADTLEWGDVVAEKVDYYFDSPVYDGWKLVCTSYDAESKWECSFDPFAMGLIRQEHIQDDEYKSGLRAVVTDSLGQTTTDEIDLYILDNIPGFAWWMTPTDADCIWDSQTLSLRTIHADSLKKVTYYYMHVEDTVWTRIDEVWNGGYGRTFTFPATWPTLTVADGDYYLGFEIVDRNDNVTAVEDNQIIMVTVNNELPSVDIVFPDAHLADSFDFETVPLFIPEGQKFIADSVYAPLGADWVQFQYKWYDSSSTSWSDFPFDADQHPPYESHWGYEDSTWFSDGFYHFRAQVRNNCGRYGYSPWYIAYHDDVAPDVNIITINDRDVENANDSVPCFPLGSDIMFEVAAFDTGSDYGSTEWTNSGVDSVWIYISDGPCCEGPPEIENWNLAYRGEVPNPNDISDYSWLTSGLAADTYWVVVKVSDKLGNEAYSDYRAFCLYDDCPPIALVAGYKECKLVGLSESDADVQFQAVMYDEAMGVPDGSADWVSVGIVDDDLSDTERLFYNECDTCCTESVNYRVFVADWKAADTMYWVRLVAEDAGDNYTEGPPLLLDFANCEAMALDMPDDFGSEHYIQKSWEFPDPCDLDGLAKFSTAYGMPFGVTMEYNIYTEEWDFDIIEFRAIPQQGEGTMFAGTFDFDELTDNGGWGWQRVFYFDAADDGSVGYSKYDHIDGYWLTEDLGTGGPVTGQDGNVTVDVPSEFTNDEDGHHELLVVWESELAPPSVWQDWLITPVGNPNGEKMYFIGNAGCGGDFCGLDNRYATIKMYYDPEVDIAAESLMVMNYKNGTWYSQNIYFPSTVEGFNTTEHYVEFAVTCLEGFYAVVRPTPLVTINRPTLTVKPWCEGADGTYYTAPDAEFWYKFNIPFNRTIDWSTLEIQVDGDRIFTGDDYTGGPVVSNIPDQIIFNGDYFESIPLDFYVFDLFYGDANLEWSVSWWNSSIWVTIDEENWAHINYAPGWYGAANFTFTATNPEGAYDQVTVGFTVLPYDGPEGGKHAPLPAAASDTAMGWSVMIDEVAKKVMFQVDSYDDYVPWLDCGAHEVFVKVLDIQKRPYISYDTVMVDCNEPDVNFANSYVSKNPEIGFTITDAETSVDWEEVYVDIFFVTKYDTTAGGSDFGSPKEQVMFMQTFFPDQLEDYMVGDDSVHITTTYELDDERAIVVAIYNGIRTENWHYEEGDWVDPSDHRNYDEFYFNHGGIYDCVGNVSSPHIQILGVDYHAPDIVRTSPEDACPATFAITEDGSGFGSMQIFENGNALPTPVGSADAVDEGGEWYLHHGAGEGGLLYYCPSDDVIYEIYLTDMVGNVRNYSDTTGFRDFGDLADVGIDAFAYPNPFDRGNATHAGIKFMFDLAEEAHVTAKVYDLSGELVATIKDGMMTAGPEKYVTWQGHTMNGTDVSTGVYLVHIEARAGSAVVYDVVKVAIIEN